MPWANYRYQTFHKTKSAANKEMDREWAHMKGHGSNKKKSNSLRVVKRKTKTRLGRTKEGYVVQYKK